MVILAPLPYILRLTSRSSILRISDVSERLEMSIETLANSRLERESLREEIKVLSAKLLKQHDAALDSQVSRRLVASCKQSFCFKTCL